MRAVEFHRCGGSGTAPEITSPFEMSCLRLGHLLHLMGQEVVRIMKKVMMLFAAVVMVMIPATASARVFIGGGFGFGPYWGPGPYYWGPPVYGYYYGPRTGEIKIDTKVKDAEVWINGAFAGTVKDAHTLHLRPGSYNVEVRHDGQDVLSEQVLVTAGKTTHLHPAM